MEKQDDHNTHTVIKQTILFVHTDVVFDKLQKKNYTVNGGSHNIVNRSKKVRKNTQNNNFEMKNLKLENDFLKNEVLFLKNQLEITQGLLDKLLQTK